MVVDADAVDARWDGRVWRRQIYIFLSPASAYAWRRQILLKREHLFNKFSKTFITEFLNKSTQLKHFLKKSTNIFIDHYHSFGGSFAKNVSTSGTGCSRRQSRDKWGFPCLSFYLFRDCLVPQVNQWNWLTIKLFNQFDSCYDGLHRLSHYSLKDKHFLLMPRRILHIYLSSLLSCKCATAAL